MNIFLFSTYALLLSFQVDISAGKNIMSSRLCTEPLFVLIVLIVGLFSKKKKKTVNIEKNILDLNDIDIMFSRLNKYIHSFENFTDTITNVMTTMKYSCSN